MTSNYLIHNKGYQTLPMKKPKSTVTFKRCDSSKAILEGMQMTKKEMQEKGLWNENTTFEDWANYAGSHIQMKELEK